MKHRVPAIFFAAIFAVSTLAVAAQQHRRASIVVTPNPPIDPSTLCPECGPIPPDDGSGN
jgi:hypothetical protein